MRGIPLTRLRKDVFFLKPFQAAEVDLVPAEASLFLFRFHNEF
jgi:hypothetical protein